MLTILKKKLEVFAAALHCSMDTPPGKYSWVIQAYTSTSNSDIKVKCTLYFEDHKSKVQFETISVTQSIEPEDDDNVLAEALFMKIMARFCWRPVSQRIAGDPARMYVK